MFSGLDSRVESTEWNGIVLNLQGARACFKASESFLDPLSRPPYEKLWTSYPYTCKSVLDLHVYTHFNIFCSLLNLYIFVGQTD